MEEKRPVSVTIISLIAIVSGAFSVFSFIKMAQISPQLRQFQVIWMVISCIASITAGIAMLKGLNWGRLLYLYFMTISILKMFVPIIINLPSVPAMLNMSNMPNMPYYKPLMVSMFVFSLVFALTYYLVILVFLTRPKVREFFGKTEKIAQ